MANTRARTINNKLAKQLQTALYGAIPPAPGARADSVEAAATPDAAMYGVMQPAYATSLAQTGNGILDPLNQMALRNGAEDESKRYGLALLAAQKGAIAQQNNKSRNDMEESLVTSRGTDAQNGMANAYNIITGPDGMSRLQGDPVASINNNEQIANTKQSERYSKYAGAIKDLHGAGVNVDPDTTAGLLTNPLSPTKATGYGVFTKDGLTPEETTNQFKAESERIDVTNPLKYSKKGGSGGEPVVTVVPGMYGLPPQVTYKGKASQMQQYLGDAGVDGPQVPAANPLQARIASAKAAGSKVEQSGANIVITGKSGARRVYNANGQQVQ